MNCYNKEYFNKYIEKEVERIKKFESYRDRCSNEQQNTQLNLTLANFNKNTLCCLLSLNERGERFKSALNEYIRLTKSSLNSVSEAEKADVLALEYLFVDSGEESYKRLTSKVGDLKDNALYSRFSSFINKGVSSEQLKSFMNEEWYSLHEDYPWYDAHKSEFDVYVGYFSFIASAIAKHDGLETEGIKYIIK